MDKKSASSPKSSPKTDILANLIDKGGVAKRIQRARQRLSLKQPELANKAGISRRMLQKYEAAAALPRSEPLAALSKALKVSTDWILFGALYINGETISPRAGEPPPQYPEGYFSAPLIHSIIRGLEEIMVSREISLPPYKKADLVIAACSLFKDRPIDSLVIHNLIRLAT